MSQQSKVWVFAEVEDGGLADVSLELVAKARDLAAQLDGGSVGALLLGEGVEPLAETLFAHGCDDAYLAEHEGLANYTTLAYAEALTEIIRDGDPEIVLFGATTTGRDLAPRVASELKAGLTADCTDLQIGPHEDKLRGKSYPKLLHQIRPAFGGNIIATIVTPETRPQMATVREGVMHLGTPEPGRTGNLVRVEPKLSAESLLVEIIERASAEKTVNLKGANIIVAGGAGGFLRQGLYIDAGEAVPNNHFLSTLVSAVGVRKEDGSLVDDFGDPSIPPGLIQDMIA